MIAATADRVERNTAAHIARKINRQTEQSLARHSSAGREAIDRRLFELDEEWDVERLIETEAPVMTLIGLALGASVSRKWLGLSVFAASMLLLHNVQGWYPLLPVLRRLGVRTQGEIAAERYALKILRGDFKTTGEHDSNGSAAFASANPHGA